MKKSKTASFQAGGLPSPIFQQSLISSQRRIRVDSFRLCQADFPLKTEGAWSINKCTLHGGRQEGVEIIEVDNGRLRFVVVSTRGMGILKVESGDVRLGWDSPVKEVVHPSLINLESRGGLGWLEGFNEWMVRCGLEWAGHPGHDKIRNNVGDEVNMELTLHGRIANTPASEVEVWIEAGTPPRIHVRGLVEERSFYGPKLSVWADISTQLGSDSLRIDDLVTNHGAHDQEFQLIYHTNFGPPLLEDGAHFLGALARVAPFNAHAAKSVNSYCTYTAPQLGFIEQVYCLSPLPGADGRTELLLQNARKDRGVSLIYSVEQLPCITLWKNLSPKAEGYVTGIEPGTGYPYTRRLEREAGRVPKLRKNETRRFMIEVKIHPNRSSVQSSKQEIQKIQGRRKTLMDHTPVHSPMPHSMTNVSR